MTLEITSAETESEISATYLVVKQLRPHLDQETYVQMVQSLIRTEGLKLIVVVERETVLAVASYRIMNMLYCGKILYVDDLVVDVQARSKGIGSMLLASLRQEGRSLGCSEVQLISRVTREQAHRFYYREGFGIECFHFRSRIP
ncbi:MAG: GNAT family N-acetyltransferase [Alphaproteobacteria bacterium]|nr:MAG: GNAT family N-acetyltransferase [Alphaproteobacteria bacterium]